MWETITKLKECTLGGGLGVATYYMLGLWRSGPTLEWANRATTEFLEKLALNLLLKLCHTYELIFSLRSKEKVQQGRRMRQVGYDGLDGWLRWVAAWEGAMAAGKGRWAALHCHAYPSCPPSSPAQPKPNQTQRKRWCAPAAASSSAHCCGSCRRRGGALAEWNQGSVGFAEDGGTKGDPGGGDRTRLCHPEHGEDPDKEQVCKLVVIWNTLTATAGRPFKTLGHFYYSLIQCSVVQCVKGEVVAAMFWLWFSLRQKIASI